MAVGAAGRLRCVTGTVTQEQREMAALLYTGRVGIITGVAAVRRHHLRSPGADAVDVLIPWTVPLR
jgi:hypothetical protein